MWKTLLRAIAGQAIRFEFQRWLLTLPTERANEAIRVTQALKQWMMSSSSSRTRAIAHLLFGDE